MQISTILIVTNDNTFLELLRKQLRDQAGSRGRLVVAGTMDEASTLLETNHPRLIVVHWLGDRAGYVQLDRLLWTTSVLARRTPVLVIAERYRVDQATMMYRMGVSEYISRTHHDDQLGRVLDSYLHPAAMPIALAKEWSQGQDEADKGWGGSRAHGRVAAQVG
jgi:DNA-binding NtrC family response regulator